MDGFLSKLFDGVGQWLDAHLFKSIMIVVVGYAIYVVGKKVLAFIISMMMKASKRDSAEKKDIEKRRKTLVSLISATWRVFVAIVIVVTFCYEVFPASSFSTLVATLGAAGVAIGLGAQSLVKDFISGIFIVSENQYRVGDVVEINGFSGKVERVGTRSTVLRDAEGSVHFFPNGAISHVTNKTMGYSNTKFDVRVSIENELEKVIEIINAVGEKVAANEKWQGKILEVPKVTGITGFDNAMVTVTVNGRTSPSDQWDVMNDMRYQISDEFRKKGIKTKAPAVSAKT